MGIKPPFYLSAAAALLLPSLVLSVACPPARGDGGCKDTGRQLSSEGGYSNDLDVSCAVIEFTIPQVATFSSPDHCQLGYKYTSQNIYTCSGSLPNVHCNPFGYEATVTVASGGACPEAPDMKGLDFSSWKAIYKVPAALVKALFCKAPQLQSTTDPSAKITACPDGSARGTGSTQAVEGFSNGDLVTTNAGMSAVFWTTDFVAASQGAQGAFNPFVTWYDELQDGNATDLSGPLAGIAASEAGLLGVKLRGTVTIEHHNPGSPAGDSTRVVHVSGDVLVDGRFDCTRRIEGTSQGTPVQIVHRTTFDGKTLRDHSEHGEVGNIYSLDASTPAWVLQVHATSIDVLSDWARSPFEIPLFSEGVQFTTQLGGDNLLLHRMHSLPSGEEFVGTTYELVQRGSVYLPVRCSNYDAAGNLRDESIWSNFVELRRGDWRPTSVVHTDYLSGDPLGATITISTTVQSVSALDAGGAASVPQPFEDGLGWLEWK